MFYKGPMRFFRAVLNKLIGWILTVPQEFALAPGGGMKLAICRFNQVSNEKCRVLPWVYTKKECSDFWKSIDNSSASTGNRPAKYSAKKQHVLTYVDGMWFPDVSKEDSIVEIGCNCGANLHWLKEMGYKDLSGVEINRNALDHMKSVFPELERTARIFHGSIQEYLSTKEDGSVDVIFSMGVAMHIHPSDDNLFDEMARVAKKYICTVEPETANSNYVFARNYRRVFQNRGCFQVRSGLITDDILPDSGYPGCTVRLMRVKKI